MPATPLVAPNRTVFEKPVARAVRVRAAAAPDQPRRVGAQAQELEDPQHDEQCGGAHDDPLAMLGEE